MVPFSVVGQFCSRRIKRRDNRPVRLSLGQIRGSLLVFKIMRSLGFLSVIIILVASNVCLADAPVLPNSVALLGTWEKTYPNGNKMSLTFEANNTLEIRYPTEGGDHDITMWRLKGDTAILFSSSGDLKGKMTKDGKLLLVGPMFGKPLYDLVLIKKS